jgi:hypothetical protein
MLALRRTRDAFRAHKQAPAGMADAASPWDAAQTEATFSARAHQRRANPLECAE